MHFIATAYSQKGETADGVRAHDGVIAADPQVLPIGSRVRVTDAGPYSGEYVVRDTGRKIAGRHIDIFIPNARQAKRFGKRRVQVQIIRNPNEAKRTG